MASSYPRSAPPQNYGSQLRDNRNYYTSGSSALSKNDTSSSQHKVNQLAKSNKAFLNAMLSPRGRQQNWEAMKRAPLMSSFILVQLIASSIPLATLIIFAGFVALTTLSIAASVAGFFIFWSIVFISPIFFFTVPIGFLLWAGLVLAWKTYNYFSDDIHALQQQASDITENASQNFHTLSHTVQANVQDLTNNLQQNASAITDEISRTKHEIEANAEKEYYGYKDNVREGTDKVTESLHQNTNKLADSLNSSVNKAQSEVNNTIDRTQQSAKNTAQQAEDSTFNNTASTRSAYPDFKYETMDAYNNHIQT